MYLLLCGYLFEVVHTVASETLPLADADSQTGSRAARHNLLGVAEGQLVLEFTWGTLPIIFNAIHDKLLNLRS